MEAKAEEQRAAKRQKLGAGGGFSADPDLEVAVEGEVVEVHSVVLMLASPVFRQMLSHSMAEAASGRVELPGKSLSEFKVFLEFLQPGNTRALTTETATFLAQWCDEYQVLGLKDSCDAFLTRQPPSIAGLAHATSCGLQARKEQCTKHFRLLLGRLDDAFFEELKDAGPTLPAEVLELIWPDLCTAAGVPAAEQGTPGDEHIQALLPFAKSAVAGVKAKNELASLKKNLAEWPNLIYNDLPQTNRMDERARESLRNIMLRQSLRFLY